MGFRTVELLDVREITSMYPLHHQGSFIPPLPTPAGMPLVYIRLGLPQIPGPKNYMEGLLIM